MYRKLIIVLLFTPFVSIYGQGTFASMKAQMTDESLPLVNLTYDESSLNSNSYIEGEIEIVDKQMRTEEGKESVEYDADFKIRGGSIAGLDKKSFAVKLFEYNKKGKKKDVDAAIFGIREEKPDNSWILDAMGYDKLRMRNRVCFDLWNEMSSTPYGTNYDNRNGTKGQFVEVFINGTYHGLYCLTDKIDRKLLDGTKYDEGTGVHGLLYQGHECEGGAGHLLSYDSNASTGTTTWNTWELEYPDDYPSAQAWQPLKDLIDFCSASTNDEDFLSNYTSHFYKSNLVDYMVMTMALNVVDNLYKNTFLSIPDIALGHRYLLTPWDMDGSLGRTNKGDVNNVLCDVTRYNETAPYNRLYVQNMDGFVDAVKKKWLELQTTTFSIEHVHSVLGAYVTKFVSTGAWGREYTKWGNAEVSLPANLSEELAYVKEWYVNNFNKLCESWGRRGDVNGDHVVDINDVNLLCDIILEKTTDYEFNIADVNLDGSINAADIVETINLIPKSE